MSDSFCGQCGKPLGEPGDRRTPIEDIRRKLDSIGGSIDFLGLVALAILSCLVYVFSGEAMWLLCGYIFAVLSIVVGIVRIVSLIKYQIRSKKGKAK